MGSAAFGIGVCIAGMFGRFGIPGGGALRIAGGG
jgi:hypothetical protein